MCQFVDKVFGVFAESLQPFPTMQWIVHLYSWTSKGKKQQDKEEWGERKRKQI